MGLEDSYRRAIAAFNERDRETWISMMDERIEIESRFSSLGNTRFHGHGGIQRWWADLAEAWEHIEVEIDDVVQVAPDETLALVHLSGRGRESGLAIRDAAAHRVRWADGRWLQLAYEDRDVAERELARHRATRSSDESTRSSAT